MMRSTTKLMPVAMIDSDNAQTMNTCIDHNEVMNFGSPALRVHVADFETSLSSQTLSSRAKNKMNDVRHERCE